MKVSSISEALFPGTREISYLPAPPEKTARNTDKKLDMPKLQVFVVEDSVAMRQSLFDDISQMEQVEVAGMAEEEAGAIASINEVRPDVVIVDLNLRHGNGLNVIKAIRNGPHDSAIGIIVLTNNTFPEFRDKSLALGADYFFDKSTEYGRIGEILERAAAGSRM